MRITIFENTTKSYDRTIVLMRLVTVIDQHKGARMQKIAFTFKLLIAIALDVKIMSEI